MERSRTLVALTGVLVLAVMGLTAPTTPASAVTATEPAVSQRAVSQRTVANTPTGVSLTPIDDKTYRVTGNPRCGLIEYTCQIHVGNVGDDSTSNYHWDGGTSTAEFAFSWEYGETRTPQYWTYACSIFDCRNSATVTSAPVTRPYPQRSITAEVQSKNDGARSAVVTGTATGKAVIKRNGRQVATASDAATGTWSTTVTGLAVGRNTLVFEQWVDGRYRDQTSVVVEIGPTSGQIVGNAGSAELRRGETTSVNVGYTAQSAFSTPSGTLRFTAPAGTTFATGQDRIRGQYLDGSTWRDFGGDSLVDGVRSADGTTYSYTLANRNWAVAKGQQFRFAIGVVTPAGATTTSGELRGALAGSFPGATFDTVAVTTTTVVGDPLTARVVTTDPLQGTARLDGATPAGTSRVDVTWTRNGSDVTRTAQLAGDGTWSITADGLPLGTTTVHVVARGAGGAQIAMTDVEVVLSIAAFTAQAAFPDDVTAPVVVSGRGQAGATVEVRDGTTVLRSTTVGPDGTWSVTLAAPGRGGTVRVTAVQVVRQADADSVPLSIDYGTAVRILSPGNGFEITPIWDTVRVSGRAEPGVVVRLGDENGPVDGYGSVTVGADGRWAITTPALEHRDQVLVATAVSKGANTTTASLQLRAG